MRCCDNPHLMDEQDPCGCTNEACFNCNSIRIIDLCEEHKQVE